MAFEQGHALVIGVGRYPYAPSLDRAQITARDAQAVATTLRDQTSCGYPEDQVRCLCEDNATRENILGRLDELATEVSQEDSVMIFYSGHGAYGDDGYYLTTYDTRLDHKKNVAKGYGIRQAELLERLKQIKTKRMLVILNACHSGEIAPDTLGDQAQGSGDTGGQNIPDELAIAILGTGEGRVLMTACRSNQRSYFIRDDPTTFFTKELVDGLRGTDIPNLTGYISIFDLYKYIYTNVSTVLQKTWHQQQEPTLTVSQGVGLLAVAFHGGPRAEAAPNIPQGLTALGDMGVVRQIPPHESKQMLELILNGRHNLAVQGNLTAERLHIGDETRRDITTIGRIQGVIGQNSGRVEQTFGNKYQTIGRDYIEHSIDREEPSQGRRVPDSRTASGATSISALQRVLERVQTDAAQARRFGADEIADMLDRAMLYLEAGLGSEQQGNHEQRRTRVEQARQVIQSVVAKQSGLHDLNQLLNELL